MTTNIALLPSIYGVGIAYPIRLDTTGTRFASASEQTLVYQSIHSICHTDTNERPFLVRNGIPYGTRLRRALFEPVPIAIDIVGFECKRALDTWEPRIIVTSVVVTQNQNEPRELDADIHFIFRSTSQADNYVVPFLTTSPDPYPS